MVMGRSLVVGCDGQIQWWVGCDGDGRIGGGGF